MTRSIPTHLLALFLLIESCFDEDVKPCYLKQAKEAATKDLKHLDHKGSEIWNKAKQFDSVMLKKRLEGMGLDEDQAFELYTAYKESRLPDFAYDLKPAKLAAWGQIKKPM